MFKCVFNTVVKQIFYSDTENPWTKIWFSVSGDFLGQILSAYNLVGVNHIENCPIEHLFRDFYAVAAQDKPKFEIFNDCAMIFLKVIQSIAIQRYDSNRPNTLAAKLKYLIDEDDAFSMGFDDLIDELHSSKSHVIRTFKSTYGVTPYQYILNKKTLLAKNLLKNTNMSISEIAENLKFCDRRYFSAFFKSQTGISPLNYRNN